MIKLFNKTSTNYFDSISDISPDKIECEIESLSALPNGWHFGEGAPPSKEIIAFAKEIYRAGKHIGLKRGVFPSLHGGVVIAFYGRENHCVEISIDENFTLSVSYEIGHGFEYTESFYKENATINDVKQQCKRLLSPKKPNLSELFIQGYSILRGEGSPAIVSKIQRATEGFPLLTHVVSSGFTAHPYAST